MINIEYKNASGETLARAEHAAEALLCVEAAYAAGDSIVITAQPGTHLMLQLDAAMAPGEVYLPEGVMRWPAPVGDERRAYSPALFAQGRHILSARAMTPEECARRRNLGCNPADLRGETNFFPHCTPNVETRGESVFAARNVIDGLRHNVSHGDWPYQSWGIGAREDAWCLLELGRDVEIDEMALTLRADFPHDAYWVKGQVELSDGFVTDFPLEKTGDRQFIQLGKHRVRWLRLQNMMKSDDPSAFPSLVEWEVFGRDL